MGNQLTIPIEILRKPERHVQIVHEAVVDTIAPTHRLLHLPRSSDEPFVQTRQNTLDEEWLRRDHQAG